MPEYTRGYLSDFFDGFAVKRLTSVEVDPRRSNQHEFQGVHKLRRILGTPTDKARFPTRYLRLEDDGTSEWIDSHATWSDVRRDNQDRSAEYHLYYSVDAAKLVHKASPDDLLLVCREKSGNLVIVITPAGSTVEKQLAWLFDFPLEEQSVPLIRDIAGEGDREIGFAARFILDELGIESQQTDENFLDLIINRFGETFPKTSDFSAFARETLTDVTPHDDPDEALLAWLDHEEKLFRTLEKHIVGQRLKEGFYTKGEPDVEGFISFSLSVQNRRKSRVGQALENHLEPLFQAREIQYARGARTEHHAKPDFLFPSAEAYHDENFSPDHLAILAVKSSCKDRWRQVLSEAARIREKHLLTLEPGISENQTAEMKGNDLRLVVPRSFQSSYNTSQRDWLFSLGDFMATVKQQQS